MSKKDSTIKEPAAISDGRINLERRRLLVDVERNARFPTKEAPRVLFWELQVAPLFQAVRLSLGWSPLPVVIGYFPAPNGPNSYQAILIYENNAWK